MATETLYVIGNGSTITGWNHEGVTGATHYTYVDDKPTQDGGTTKLYSPIQNDIVTFAMENTAIPVGSTINSVAVHVVVMKLDPPGTITSTPVIRAGGSNYNGTAISPSTNNVYEDFATTWNTNPATGVAWTLSDIDAMECGILKSSAGGMRVTQVYAVVDYTEGPPTETDTYYFNGHNGISDPSGAWSNDANAFDGNTGTAASTTTTGDAGTNYLEGAGTTAPTSGTTITQVRARMLADTSSAAQPEAYIGLSAGFEELGQIVGSDQNAYPGYSDYVTLFEPDGGWEWSQLESAVVRVYLPSGVQGSVYKVELEITHEASNDTELTIDEATLALGSDSPSLTQQHLLSIADATLALSTDQPALTQHYLLSIGDASLALQSDAPALTQNYTLAINDATLGLTADSPALLQQHLLAITDAGLGLTSDNIDLVQQQLLDINDASLAIASDSLALDTSFTLAINDASLALASDEGGLVQQFTLDIDDASLGLGADTVSLDQNTVLVIADATLALASESLSLVQQHVVTINDGSLGLISDAVTLSAGLTLSIDDASLTLSSDSLSITQHQVLSIEDATFGMTADSLDLVQQHVLAIDDSALALGSDDVELVQAFLLAIADASLALSADELMLSSDASRPISATGKGNSLGGIRRATALYSRGSALVARQQSGTALGGKSSSTFVGSKRG